MVPPRARERVLRERDDALRGFAVRFAAGLRAVDERLVLVDDFARDAADFFAVLRFAVDRFAVALFVVARFAGDLRAPVRRGDDEEPEPDPALALPSTDHFPDMTRCAASATASAIKDPSFVALAMTLLAA